MTSQTKMILTYYYWRVIHNWLNLENFCSSPNLSPLHSVLWTIIACCQKTSWNGIPACLPAVRCIHSESPQRKNCALCHMCAKIDALMLHTWIWGISREHNNTSHFQKKTFDLTLDEVGCLRGTSMEKCRSMWKAAICSGAINKGWGWGTN